MFNRLILLLIFVLAFDFAAISQKPAINDSSYEHWPQLKPLSPLITSDGEFVCYRMLNDKNESLTIFKSVNTSWERILKGDVSVTFSDRGHTAVCQEGEVLFCIYLGTDKVDTIGPVGQCLYVKAPDGLKLLYIKRSPEGYAVLSDASFIEKKQFTDVKSVVASWNMKQVLLVRSRKQTDSIKVSYVDLVSGREQLVWEGPDINNVVFSRDGSELAFTPDDISSRRRARVYIWNRLSDRLRQVDLVFDSSSLNNFTLTGISSFIEGSDNLLVTLREDTVTSQHTPGPISVDVWSYKDESLQSEQLVANHDLAYEYQALLNTQDGQIRRIEQTGEKLSWEKGQTGLITKFCGHGGGGESHWNPAFLRSYYLVSMVTGKRKLVVDSTQWGLTMSPTGKYLIYFDPKSSNYFCIETKSLKVRNITGGIQDIWFKHDFASEPYNLFDVAGWEDEDRFLYVHSLFDIWKLDLGTESQPVCITKGIGLRDSAIYRVQDEDKIFNEAEPVIFSVFNLRNKQNGIVLYNSTRFEGPAEKQMGDYIYWVPSLGMGVPPVKAKRKNVWVVYRMSSRESGNYFITSDFRTFHAITEICPERNVNWLRSELHQFQLPNGIKSHGVLYKPEDFDPNRRYPIIFYVYQQLSMQLNKYLTPELSDGRLNISTYVSNGYLVFTPDIYYKIGSPGESALSSVTSAVEYLSQFPYVDQSKIGIQGMSWGGYQTNYIVTHSNLFAAACSSVGQTDLISFYGSLSEHMSGASMQGYTEVGQGRMGATLWDNSDAYLKGSPVLSADKVTTPLLLMYNKNDARNFFQGVEFFTALRRLRKKCWMLQYDEQGHGLIEAASNDFDKRMRQFFDFYLKESVPPIWMTRTRPAKFKSLNASLDTDSTNAIP